MARKNDKEQLINYENSIQKSNDFSFSKLSNKLTLNQMQLLAYAIFSTQKNGKTKFIKADFEKKFGMARYNTSYAYRDSERLLDLKVSLLDKEKNRFKHWNVFTDMEYSDGLFVFNWHNEILPYILNLKERFTSIDLTIVDKFKSEFSWMLYDHLKSLYGYWNISFTKDEILELFKVQDRKTYQKHTGVFKQMVLNVAIEEINEHTELDVRYEEKKQGRSIVGFVVKWSTGKTIASATTSQISALRPIVEVITDDMFKYTNLKNEENRERAIEMIREIEYMRIHTKEPISITKEYADQLINKANDYLRQLELMLEKDDRESIYYNWLEEQGV